MESIVKVGGSLVARAPESLRELCQVLSRLVGEFDFLVVPGGGKFADIVREFDREYSLSGETSHKMAILAMDQYATLLADLISNSRAIDSLEKAEKVLSDGFVPILLPASLLFSEDPVEHSWDFTSDSIAAWIAGTSNAEKLILITDVDGIFPQDPKKHLKEGPLSEVSVKTLSKATEKTCVDKGLSEILPKTNLECYVVNGKRPSRVRRILEEKETICTKITI